MSSTKIVTIDEVSEKIDTLIDYSIETYEAYYAVQTGPETHVDISTLFEPLNTALETFFDPQDLSNAVQSVLSTMKADLVRRSIRFEQQANFGFPTDFPNGYESFTQFAYNFDEIMSISNEDFYKGFYWETETNTENTENTDASDTSDTDGETSTTKKLAGNTYITAWITKLETEKSRECADLETVANWCKNATGNFFELCQTESYGNILSKLDDQDAYIDIFINRGLYDLIKVRQLANHIPSYITEKYGEV